MRARPSKVGGKKTAALLVHLRVGLRRRLLQPAAGLRLIKAFVDDRPENVQRARRFSLFLALGLWQGTLARTSLPFLKVRLQARERLLAASWTQISGEGYGLSPQSACCSLVSHKCGTVMAACLSTSRASACITSHNLDWA